MATILMLQKNSKILNVYNHEYRFDKAKKMLNFVILKYLINILIWVYRFDRTKSFSKALLNFTKS